MVPIVDVLLLLPTFCCTVIFYELCLRLLQYWPVVAQVISLLIEIMLVTRALALKVVLQQEVLGTVRRMQANGNFT